MKTVSNTLSLVLLAASLSVASGGTEVKTIIIDRSSFSEAHPAVVFNPEDGTTQKLEDFGKSTPTKGLLLIEPNDPEFASDGDGTKVILVGYGDAVFKGKVSTKGKEAGEEIDRAVLAGGEKPVVVIDTGVAKCVVIIDHVDPEAQWMKLRWRKWRSKS